jgi:prevent-host-death family protein
MQKKSATDAAKNFGELLDEAQHDPVIIEKRGRPIAVVYSYWDSMSVENLRLEALQNKIAEGDSLWQAGDIEVFDQATLDSTKRTYRRKRLTEE